MPKRDLPVRANLENLRKQAKALHRAFLNGDTDAIDRIRENLPRINELPEAEVAEAELSRQEAQHVLAREYGYATWEKLRMAVGASFEALADLPPAAIQEIFRHTERQDWIRALPQVSERMREAVFHACLTRSGVRELADEMAAYDPPPQEGDAAQQRILETVGRLATDGQFDWPPRGEMGNFEDLARLTDREIQNLMREISQKDLCRALVGAPEAVWGRVLSNMSRRVRTFVTEESERLAPDLPDHEPQASRQRLLEWAEVLGRDGRIQWPSPAHRPAWTGDLEGEVKVPSPPPEDPLGGLSLEELSIDELAQVYGEMAGIAQREGILALEDVARAPGPLAEGIRLAVDGTVAELIEAILNTRTETMVHHRRVRLRMILEGVASLQAGDNPWIIFHKMQVFYLDSGSFGNPRRVNEEIGADELCDWLERGWLGNSTPAEIAELMLHLAFVARREGIEALEVVLGALEQPLLEGALLLIIESRETAVLQRQMQPEVEQELRGLEGRLRGVTAGVLGIAAKKKPSEVVDAVRAAAEEVTA
jgi:hypothetical protein